MGRLTNVRPPFPILNTDVNVTDEQKTYADKVAERNKRQQQINDLSPYLRAADVDEPWAFLSFFFAAPPPDPASNQNLPIPIPRQSIPWLCKVLWDSGVRLHPELATVHKIPLQPGMSWQDPGVWVDTETYQKWCEKAGSVEQPGDIGPSDEQFEEAMNLLEQVNPDLAEMIREATPAQRQKLLKKQDPKRIAKLMQALMEDVDDLPESH